MAWSALSAPRATTVIYLPFMIIAISKVNRPSDIKLCHWLSLKNLAKSNLLQKLLNAIAIWGLDTAATWSFNFIYSMIVSCLRNILNSLPLYSLIFVISMHVASLTKDKSYQPLPFMSSSSTFPCIQIWTSKWTALQLWRLVRVGSE